MVSHHGGGRRRGGYIQPLQGPTPAAGRQAIDPRADKGAHADHVQPTRLRCLEIVEDVGIETGLKIL